MNLWSLNRFQHRGWHYQCYSGSAKLELHSWQRFYHRQCFIVLEHDLFQQTVQIATGYILPDALAYNNPPFNITPIIECLHKPLSDAYIETNDNKSNPPPLQGLCIDYILITFCETDVIY